MATRYALCTIMSALWALAAGVSVAHAAPHPAVPPQVECIAPAQPGGGFDLTCRLLAEALATQGIAVTSTPLPGGVGAVAFNTILNQRNDDPAALVAFSEGSIYNLTLGRYGPHDLDDMRWIAVLAMDYGAVLVRADAPWTGLAALLDDARAQPQHIAFGGGGGIGGQDWTRIMMTADLAGIDRARLRYVALEGGGNCIDALLAGFVQVCLNDVGDSRRAIDNGAALRILAVHAPRRLPPPMDGLPTAREQGVALDWPVIRGVYTGGHVSPTDAAAWEATLVRAMSTPAYRALLDAHHLRPLTLTGDALRARLTGLAQEARRRATHLGVP